MRAEIRPSRFLGEIAAPVSKSAAHRLLIASALSDGAKILGRLSGEDIQATVRCLSALGAEIAVNENSVTVERIELKEAAALDCGESGSTLRFLLPVAAAFGVNAEFYGRGRLMERPVQSLLETLESRGVKAEAGAGSIKLFGKLSSGAFVIDGTVSSQYITGLLFALPVLEGDSEIIIKGEAVSASYIEITKSILEQFKIDIKTTDRGFFIKGGQKYISPGETVCEGDFSGAAFFLVGGALTGEITVSSLNPEAKQGDKVVLELLARSGAEVTVEHGSVTVRKKEIRPISFSASDCPDIAPIMAVYLAAAKGKSKIESVGRLKAKESDRLAETIKLLKLMGAGAEYSSDALYICGRGKAFNGFEYAANDHRMAMSAAIAGAYSEGGAVIWGAECVDKSYPDFFKDFIKTGGKARTETD